jgi:hypothetical protein
MIDKEDQGAMDAARKAHPPPHPDEGTIHAWLDGALDAPAAEALEAHVASCPSCAERVAEARGLIAGASRIVGALDDVPSGAAPAWGAPAASATHGSRSAWRLLRVTPARAAIAATILVAIGVTLTRDRVGPDTVRDARVATVMSEPAASQAPAVAEATPTAGAPHDKLLDSAVARNLAAAQPPRAVKAAPEKGGADISPPPPSAGSPAMIADPSAPTRVAVGRAAILAQRETAGVAADRSKVGADAQVVGRNEMMAAKRADAASAPAIRGASAPTPAASRATECYRVESANGTPATWGSVALPFVVALDSTANSAHIFAPSGTETGSRASWTRAGDDSLIFRLQRPGYQGTLALGGAGEVRAGVMRSAELRTAMQEMVVASADAPAKVSRQPSRRAKPAGAAAGAASQPAVAPAPEQDPASAAPAVAVVARRVGCVP